MDMLIARQPIFDKHKNVYGYELLYRETDHNAYVASDGDMASSNVILGSFLSLGFQSLTGDKKAFVNFTDNLLTLEIPTLLPPDSLVIEILETVAPHEEIISACKKLKNAGYTIALDDFIFKPDYMPLIDLADIVKVDFLACSDKEKASLIKRLQNGKIRFLAEKVETQEAFEQALEIGYTYFQGYFFAKPVILSTNIIPPAKLNQMQLIKSINVKEPDFGVLAAIIERDPAYAYEILRIVNTMFFDRGTRIKSIRQALVRIGLDELRKWCYIAVLRNMAEGKHNEAINFCMVRARFLELFSQIIGMGNSKSEFMTVGVLSMLDVLSGFPLERILAETPISDKVKDTLLHRENDSKMAKSYYLLLEYEKGYWENVNRLAEDLQVDIKEITRIYFAAIRWVIEFAERIK
jgi:EAL and modified HD-GYP domain-containing signal transduction protein